MTPAPGLFSLPGSPAPAPPYPHGYTLGVAIPPAFPFPLTPPAGVELIALFPPPAVMLPNTEEEPLRRSKLALV